MSYTKNIVIDFMNKIPNYKNPKYCWKANRQSKYIVSINDLLLTSHAQNMDFIKKLYK